jgi:hypothetical protein
MYCTTTNYWPNWNRFAARRPAGRSITRTDLGTSPRGRPKRFTIRAQDLWRPLLAVAEVAGGDWMDRAPRAAVQLAGVQPQENSVGVQLLASIQSIFETQRTDRLSSETIVHVLAEREDSPWPDRLPLTKAQLARLLAPFGIRPTIVHRTRTQVSRGYRLQDFHDAFARYLPK